MASALKMFEHAILNDPANAALVERYAPFLTVSEDKKELIPELKTRMDQYVMAKLLDNTRRVLSGTNEATQLTTAFGANYVPAMMGMIRQIYPRLIASQISSIQPMSLPTGKVFKLDMLRDDLSDPADYSNWASSATYADAASSEAQTINTGMALRITSADITLGTPKKLRVSASLELQQDLQAYHNLNALELLQQAAVDEIQREIDGQLVAAAYAAGLAHKTVNYGSGVPTSYANTPGEWRKRLSNAVLRADNAIYKSTGRNATFMVAGADAALHLMDMNDFRFDGSFSGGSEGPGSYGLERIGSLGAQYSVLRSRYVADNQILIGRKGDSILDAGLFWLPYVPLYVSPRQFNVSNLTEEQAFMSRAGIYVASNKYFAVIDINSGTGGITE